MRTVFFRYSYCIKSADSRKRVFCLKKENILWVRIAYGQGEFRRFYVLVDKYRIGTVCAVVEMVNVSASVSALPSGVISLYCV